MKKIKLENGKVINYDERIVVSDWNIDSTGVAVYEKAFHLNPDDSAMPVLHFLGRAVEIYE